ncbi:GroES-like protein [Lentithecium fluviatile CBS 122367]|uniref:GroES-like protein n=1 Tax=Lentithecium fluviatile CBS 122367 TaxID=1168545 RepID=A0A6G1IKI8_9PLEO|nr:GroES-like protein [Lentithecium fluviatile CBS 122367]
MASRQMQAAQIVEFNKPYQLSQVPVPQCGDHDLLVQVYAAGFCHSDLQVLRGQFGAALPLIPSHEPAGKIAQVGTQVKGSWKVGDRIGVLNFKNACGQCVGCRQRLRRTKRTDPRFCRKRQTAGFKHDGAFGQFMLADPNTTVHLPEKVSFEQGAPLMCAGATVWGALQKLKPDVKPGEAVAIIGIGGLGQLGIQFAKAMGYRTVAIDNRHEGRRLAVDVSEILKPDLVIDSSAPDASDQILDFTAGEGLAGAVVCTDSIEANAWSLQQLGNGGVMVPVGLPQDRWQFDSEAMVFRELTIRGVYVASMGEVEEMLKVVAHHDISSHITTVDFDQIPSIVERYADKSMKGRLVVQITQ